MDFIDLKDLAICELTDFVTMELRIDGAKLLDMPLSKAQEYMRNVMRINYKNENVSVKVVVKNFHEDDKSAEDEDFEAICNLVTGTILRLNMSDQERSDKEKGKVMNKLTTGQYMLHPDFMNRLNAPISTVRQCGDWKMINKSINIYVEQEDGELHFELISPKKEKK
jgi:hypothetical protein